MRRSIRRLAALIDALGPVRVHVVRGDPRGAVHQVMSGSIRIDRRTGRPRYALTCILGLTHARDIPTVCTRLASERGPFVMWWPALAEFVEPEDAERLLERIERRLCGEDKT